MVQVVGSTMPVCEHSLEGKVSGIYVYSLVHDARLPQEDRPYFEIEREEEDIKAMFNLDDEQIMFRRLKIQELGGEDLFRQEYPLTPQEAFLTTGRLFVEPKYIDQAAVECFTPIGVATMCVKVNSYHMKTVHPKNFRTS